MKLYLGLLEGSRPDQTRIFTEIDGFARPGCILATNTSTLNIDEIADGLTEEQVEQAFQRDSQIRLAFEPSKDGEKLDEQVETPIL